MDRNYLLIAVAIILIVMGIRELNDINISDGSLLSIIGGIAFVLLGVVNLRSAKKKEEDNASS
ncbi:hypothetical protein EI546_06720 [Aequorivita sp. H23M31]|uniref:Uncharacterized protein n=1 Tax=Aequorivita ciconiae TaxID=2494375 RepID=A0A410G2H3_9FLAO|nr:hypothetical protein [Aequorivita sp. H23M31]QAA81441.1 hypothetical protein EI546_06720 [Aequorivita sp. H23M31]